MVLKVWQISCDILHSGVSQAFKTGYEMYRVNKICQAKKSYLSPIIGFRDYLYVVKIRDQSMSHRKILALIALVYFCLVSICSNGQSDFKNLTWGMSSDAVYKVISRDKSEKITDINDNSITVNGMLSNCKGWRMYCFVNDRLFKITGTLYQPLMFMNCDAKLWEKYDYTKIFFSTLEEKGFLNRSKSVLYDKKQIRIDESGPLMSKEKINGLEKKIGDIEQKKLSDNPGLGGRILLEFLKFEFFNQRSDAFVYFLSPGSTKTRCNEKYVKQENDRRDLLQFTIQASDEIYNKFTGKAF